MKLKFKRKSDEVWEVYLRVKDMRDNFNENSIEWHTLNNRLWNIIEKYIDVLLKEFK